MLFESRLPNSKTEQLINEINKGRTRWDRESIEAFADAIAWPGNVAALPVLEKMVDDGWDTAAAGRLCIAQIKDWDGPNELLKLLGSESRGFYLPRGPRRASDVLRRARWEATNQAIIDPASLHGIKDIDALGLETKNALGWPGNTAMADLYMGLDDATLTRFANKVHYAWTPWSERWEIPAVRTRDRRCLDRARKRFTKAVLNSINPDGSVKAGAHAPNVVAGVESANEETLEAIGRMLKLVERVKVEAERAHEELVKDPDRDPWAGPILMDPGGSIRDQILRALCVNPVPHVSRVVGQYRDHEESEYYAGLAMLRAGEVEGLELLTRNAARCGQVTESLIVYAGRDFSVEGRYVGVRVEEMRAWWSAHRNDAALAARVERVNRSKLLDDMVEDLKYWP
jgi:hypothetical protein